MYPLLQYHARYFHCSKTPLYSVQLSLSLQTSDNHTAVFCFFFLKSLSFCHGYSLLPVVPKDCTADTGHSLLRKGVQGDCLLTLVVTCPPLGSPSWRQGRTPCCFLDRQRREEEIHSHSLQKREKRKREEKIHLSLRGKGGKKCKRTTLLQAGTLPKAEFLPCLQYPCENQVLVFLKETMENYFNTSSTTLTFKQIFRGRFGNLNT